MNIYPLILFLLIEIAVLGGGFIVAGAMTVVRANGRSEKRDGVMFTLASALLFFSVIAIFFLAVVP